MKLFASYLGPQKTKYFLVTGGTRIEFPYQMPVEVTKEAAKYLRSLTKRNTDDPMFKITAEEAKVVKDKAE